MVTIDLPAVVLPKQECFPAWQLASILACSTDHVARLVDSGELRTPIDLRTKSSSRAMIRIPRASVIEFLERRKITPVLNGTNGHLHTRVIAGGGHSKNGRSHL